MHNSHITSDDEDQSLYSESSAENQCPSSPIKYWQNFMKSSAKKAVKRNKRRINQLRRRSVIEKESQFRLMDKYQKHKQKFKIVEKRRDSIERARSERYRNKVLDYERRKGISQIRRESFYEERFQRNRDYSIRKTIEMETRLKEIEEEREFSRRKKRRKGRKKFESACKRKRLVESIEMERVTDLSVYQNRKREKARIKKMEFERIKEDNYRENVVKYQKRRERAKQRRQEDMFNIISQRKNEISILAIFIIFREER